jgi:hypothetical protein
MKPVIWMGALLTLLGILGLAAPVFTTSQTKDVVSLGDLKIQNTEHSTHDESACLDGSGWRVLSARDGYPGGLSEQRATRWHSNCRTIFARPDNT